MRILVYGAGVLGCELAHVLLQNKKNDVTLLARGEWKERIDQKGLVIRQWAQRKTTVDRVRTIDVLAPEDFYDLVFVVLQAGQLPDVLPVLKANRSPYFVFVGNDPHAKQVLEAMQRPADKVAFGFQNTAGRRERDRVVSVHTGVGMTVGGATAPLSGTFRIRLKTAFDGTKYKLTFYSDMDEWLKCHIAFILPVCYVCYACNGDLCKGKIQLNIEIKPNAATPELEAETVRIIREKGFEKDCVITSQSYETLCKVKELDPEIETGYILALGVGTYYDLPAANFFSVESTFITSGMVQQIHLRGKTVSAWTVNRTEDARALLSLGVDDVITDKPEMVQDLLNEDADLDRNLVLMRDRLKELLGLTESADSEVDPDDSAIEEVLEDPEKLLDQA